MIDVNQNLPGLSGARAREFLRESLIASGYFSNQEGGHVL